MKKIASISDFKRVQKMSLNDFNRWVSEIYRTGFLDGMEKKDEKIVAEITDDCLLKTMLSVKGIGEKRARQVIDIIMSYGDSDESKD